MAAGAAADGAGKGSPWVVAVSAVSPTNIAVIKYWGKRDEERVLPLNSSLSATLDPRDLCASTTVAASPAFRRDRLWLNGKEVPLTSHRYQACLEAVRARARAVTRDAAPLRPRAAPQGGLEGQSPPTADEWEVEEGGGSSSSVSISAEDWRGLRLHIVSRNNFPTAAGLASSAAGFACLVYAAAQLMGVEEAYPGELSALARMGSGSACRSLYGGFVRWNRGEREDGSDSIAEQVARPQHWPSMRVIVAVVNDAKKAVSSTGGMATSVATSPLLAFRAEKVVPGRMREMEAAVASRDFSAFCRVTCSDSNQFHATCLDTSPPIFYLNAISQRIIGLVEQWNRQGTEGEAPKYKAAYTFDAGPNAVLFVEADHAPGLMRLLLQNFAPPTPAPPDFIVGNSEFAAEMREVAKEQDSASVDSASAGGIKYFICTGLGEGAQVTTWKPTASAGIR